MNGSTTESMKIGECIEEVRQVGVTRHPGERCLNILDVPVLWVSDDDGRIGFLQDFTLYGPPAASLVFYAENECIWPPNCKLQNSVSYFLARSVS
jgi:hypothetical protein